MYSFVVKSSPPPVVTEANDILFVHPDLRMLAPEFFLYIYINNVSIARDVETLSENFLMSLFEPC